MCLLRETLAIRGLEVSKFFLKCYILITNNPSLNILVYPRCSFLFQAIFFNFDLPLNLEKFEFFLRNTFFYKKSASEVVIAT
jgi:hypothetical protein